MERDRFSPQNTFVSPQLRGRLSRPLRAVIFATLAALATAVPAADLEPMPAVSSTLEAGLSYAKARGDLYGNIAALLFFGVAGPVTLLGLSAHEYLEYRRNKKSK